MNIFDRLSLYWHKLRFLSYFGYKKLKKSHIYGSYSIVRSDNLTFGGELGINDYVYINATGGIELGDNVILSAGSKLISTGLVFKNKSFEYKSDPIKIGNNVQIGAGAMVLSGVSIVDNVIIGAGAIVTKNILLPGVYVGQPAIKIKDV